MRLFSKILALHVLFWSLYILRISTFWEQNFPTYKEVALNVIFLAIPAYINYFLLVPNFMEKVGKNKATLLKITLWLICYLSIHLLSLHIGLASFFTIHHTFWNPVPLEWSAIMFLFIGSFSTGSRLLLVWHRNELLATQLKLQKKEATLKKFKAELNSIHLLATLNKLVKRSRIAPSLVQNPLLSLADVLRYTIYESQKELIFIEKEVKVIEQFMSLQNSIQNYYHLQLVTQINSSKMIPPNLLLRFIQEWLEYSEDYLEQIIVITCIASESSIALSMAIPEWQFEEKEGFEFRVQELKAIVENVDIIFDAKSVNLIFS